MSLENKPQYTLSRNFIFNFCKQRSFNFHRETKLQSSLYLLPTLLMVPKMYLYKYIILVFCLNTFIHNCDKQDKNCFLLTASVCYQDFKSLCRGSLAILCRITTWRLLLNLCQWRRISNLTKIFQLPVSNMEPSSA